VPKPYPKPGAVWTNNSSFAGLYGRKAEVLKVWKESGIPSGYVTHVAVRYLDNNLHDQWDYRTFMIQFMPEPELCNDGLPVGDDRSRSRDKPQRRTAWDHLLQETF
jgi:hypothetical protein